MRENPFKQIYQSPEYKDAWKLPLRDFPMILDLELTNRCNLSCQMCPRQMMTRPEGNFDYRLFPQIIKEGKEHGLKGIRFILFGEPTLNPALASCIMWAHRNGILTHLTTNGTTMTRWKADHLMRAGLDSIIFSFQGTNYGEYEKMRGVSWKTVQHGVDTLVALRNEYGLENPFITCTTTILDETPVQVQSFKDYWLSRGVDQVDVWETNLERVKSKIPLELYKRQRLSPPKDTPCNEVYTKMNILYNGDVCLCCDDVNCDVKMGTFPAQSLYDIWHGDIYGLRRLAFETGIWDKLCEACHTKF